MNCPVIESGSLDAGRFTETKHLIMEKVENSKKCSNLCAWDFLAVKFSGLINFRP